MKKQTLRLAALVLCLTLVLTGCNLLPFGPTDNGTNPGGNRINPNDNRRTIAYMDMEYVRPDGEAIKTQLLDLADKIANADKFSDVQTYDNESWPPLEEFYTMYSLAQLRNYQDTSDSYYEEEFRYCSEIEVEISNAVNKLNMAIVEGPFADDYRQWVGDDVFESIENGLLLTSDSVEDFKKERAQLNVDYNQALADKELTADGRTYTLEDIYEIAYNDGYDTYLQYIKMYFAQDADVYAGYYAAMVEQDKATARELGFTSAADMYYLSYDRDYSATDARQILQAVRDTFSPMVAALSDSYFYAEESDLSTSMSALPDLLSDVDLELQQAWNHMTSYELYDFEARENKMDGGFTTYLNAYDAPFSYAYWDDSTDSLFTVIHEFGHYYDNWLRYNTASSQSLDVAEIYSQTLELLMLDNLGSLITHIDEVEKRQVQDILENAIVLQAMNEEFQFRAYELDTFDANILGRLYAELKAEYGLSTLLVDENGCDNSWYFTTHFFDAPFYTMSYTASALVAMQIWSIAQEDWNTGADLYLSMIHADQNQPFIELVQSVGLENPIATSTMEDMADVIATFFDISALPQAA